MAPKPVFDVWICQGRMCTAHGADRLAVEAKQHVDADRCRVLRGGCYGLCEIGANMVVRRFDQRTPHEDTAADRLTLTGGDNETVYSGISSHDVATVLRSHLEDDAAVEALKREAREASMPPRSDVAARIRALRDTRKKGAPGGG